MQVMSHASKIVHCEQNSMLYELQMKISCESAPGNQSRQPACLRACLIARPEPDRQICRWLSFLQPAEPVDLFSLARLEGSCSPQESALTSLHLGTSPSSRVTSLNRLAKRCCQCLVVSHSSSVRSRLALGGRVVVASDLAFCIRVQAQTRGVGVVRLSPLR